MTCACGRPIRIVCNRARSPNARKRQMRGANRRTHHLCRACFIAQCDRNRAATLQKEEQQ